MNIEDTASYKRIKIETRKMIDQEIDPVEIILALNLLSSEITIHVIQILEEAL